MAYDAPFLVKYKPSNLRQPRLLHPITISVGYSNTLPLEPIVGFILASSMIPVSSHGFRS
jgi:hypothetical protein